MRGAQCVTFPKLERGCVRRPGSVESCIAGRERAQKRRNFAGKMGLRLRNEALRYPCRAARCKCACSRSATTSSQLKLGRKKFCAELFQSAAY